MVLVLAFAPALGRADVGTSWNIEPGARLPATGGVTEIEGAAGGGLVPWALIGGYETHDQIGLTAFYTQADPSDFRLNSFGLAIGIRDRVELSFAEQRLWLGSTIPGQSIAVDVVGLKVKLFGDAVYDQDRWWPQVAAGVQYKHNQDMAIPKALGAQQGSGFDFYLAATKVYFGAAFGRNVLVNATLRATRANQLGLLGFGGDLDNNYRLMPELSAGVFLTDKLMLGAEYRFKPNNLNSFVENDYNDVFLAFFPTKRISITAAFASLGQIADKHGQQAFYLSGQLSF